MTCDLMFSVPWACGDRNCPVQWHLAGYWFDDEIDTGYTVDRYSDGDHEAIEKDDLPSFEEQEKEWAEYFRHVVRTGSDPLREFFGVKDSRKVKQRWQFKFRSAREGVVLVSARHAGKPYSWRTLPDHVKKYLHIKRSAKLHDFADWAEFSAAVEKVKPLQWFTANIENNAPRPAALVAKELKTAARKAIREKRIA